MQEGGSNAWKTGRQDEPSHPGQEPPRPQLHLPQRLNPVLTALMPLKPLPNPPPAASHHSVTAGDCLLSLEMEMAQENPSPGQRE